jgi:protein-S-isoprenylcysteine O-methyltransferase Ste14
VWNAWLFTACLVVRRPLLRLLRRDLWEKMVSPPASEQGKRERTVRILTTVAKWSTVTYSIFLPLRLGTIWFYVGLPLTALGVAAYAIAWVNFVTTSVGKPVTKGLYRYSRHPMEVTTFVTLLGLSIATSSWFLLLLSSILTVLSCLSAISRERFLLGKYGDSYQEYANRTPRWL